MLYIYIYTHREWQTSCNGDDVGLKATINLEVGVAKDLVENYLRSGSWCSCFQITISPNPSVLLSQCRPTDK